jgi:hypothetical protein
LAGREADNPALVECGRGARGMWPTPCCSAHSVGQEDIKERLPDMNERPVRVDDHAGRHRRLFTVLFWVVAVMGTAFAWSGVSLREVLVSVQAAHLLR